MALKLETKIIQSLGLRFPDEPFRKKSGSEITCAVLNDLPGLLNQHNLLPLDPQWARKLHEAVAADKANAEASGSENIVLRNTFSVASSAVRDAMDRTEDGVSMHDVEYVDLHFDSDEAIELFNKKLHQAG